jgi:hypothetical protein
MAPSARMLIIVGLYVTVTTLEPRAGLDFVAR